MEGGEIEELGWWGVLNADEVWMGACTTLLTFDNGASISMVVFIIALTD